MGRGTPGYGLDRMGPIGGSPPGGGGKLSRIRHLAFVKEFTDMSPRGKQSAQTVPGDALFVRVPQGRLPLAPAERARPRDADTLPRQIEMSVTLLE